MTYKLSLPDGPDDSLLLTKCDDSGEAMVLKISKTDIFCHYMQDKNKLIVSVNYRRNPHALISLDFNMTITKSEYETLLAGTENEITEKLTNFYLETVKSLKAIEKSF